MRKKITDLVKPKENKKHQPPAEVDMDQASLEQQQEEPTTEKELLEMLLNGALPERFKKMSQDEFALETARLRKGAGVVATDDGIDFNIPGGNYDDGTRARIKAFEAFGVTEFRAMRDLLTMLTGAMATRELSKEDACEQLNQALGILAELAPQDAHQGILAAELLAVHNAGMRFLGKALRDETREGANIYTNLATKLLRTANSLSITLAKFKEPSKPAMGNVSVGDGSQAVIGDIHHHAGQGDGKK
jgi:hypothetical protein